MNDSTKNLQPETKTVGTRKRRRFTARLFGRFLQFTDKYKYAPLGTAIASAFTIFTLGGTLCTLGGIVGSATVFLTLGIISVATFAVVHSALLYRSRAQAQSLVQPVQLFEIRRELDQLLPQIDQDTGIAIQRIVHQYEKQIRDFEEELSRLQRRDIPGKPVIVESGRFVMGSDGGEQGESPAHEVYVSAFFIDKYPVINGQFAEFVNDPANEAWRQEAIYQRYGIPYYLPHWDGLVPLAGAWDHPVVNINWFACVAFCNWRSMQEGRQPVYTFVDDFTVQADFSKHGWRLPTEAEWEKAARAGHDNLRYPWQGHLTPTRANYGKHHRGTTPVGQFPANDFGIFDMLGNVKEWCHDCYNETVYAERSETEVKDPVIHDGSPFRVFRGGSWMDQAEWIHLSKRGRIYAQNMNQDFGFRCVRVP
ncbi:MAG: formylglycine-generating enzyme family protein [Candidatus Bathyarchaeia archaeon]